MLIYNNIPEGKICSGCDKYRPSSEFYQNKMGRGGLHSRCKECRRSVREARVDRMLRCHPEIMEITKRCTKCGEYKSGLQFYKSIDNPDRLQSICKSCDNSRKRIWEILNPSKRRVQALKFKYGISQEQYLRILKKQGGRCAICREETSFLMVDHCHSSRLIRGLLCSKCNSAIGFLGDSIESLQRAIIYLCKPHKV